MAAYQEAARLAPENSKTWCNLSAVWFERGDFEQAEKAARRTLELKPDYARAWDNLASALSAMNRLEEAADACQHAIRIQTALHSAWFKFGVVNFQLNNMFVATEAFNMTGENADFFPYVLYYSSMIESRRGDLELAVENSSRREVGRSEQRAGADPDQGTRDRLHAKNGNNSEAADCYAEITQK